MEENKKMNWGTLILGIVLGAVVVGVVWMASKPAVSGAAAEVVFRSCKVDNSINVRKVECININSGRTVNFDCDQYSQLRKIGLISQFSNQISCNP